MFSGCERGEWAAMQIRFNSEQPLMYWDGEREI